MMVAVGGGPSPFPPPFLILPKAEGGAVYSAHSSSSPSSSPSTDRAAYLLAWLNWGGGKVGWGGDGGFSDPAQGTETCPPSKKKPQKEQKKIK